MKNVTQEVEMKRFRNVLWGLAFIAVGLLIAGKILDVIRFEIFFDGWWTLFIIVPCFIGLFDKGSKTGNLIGMGIGVVLLLACQDILDFSLVWKLLFPAILIIIGCSFIFKDVVGKKVNDRIKELNSKRSRGEGYNSQHAAVFSGLDLKFDNEQVNSMNLDAVFGGIDVDLRNAIINDDVVINATAIFGGIDIKVPDNVNVEVKSTSIFGGVSSDKANVNEIGRKTIYVNGSGVFGGVSIK